MAFGCVAVSCCYTSALPDASAQQRVSLCRKCTVLVLRHVRPVKHLKSACIAVISSRMERYRTANFVLPRLETEAVSALTARESRRRPSLNEADKPSSSDSGKGSRER